MEVYLVRHGETAGNLAHRHQHPNTRLTERGEAQAKEAAERLKAVSPTHLITSTNLRAVETAKFIADATGLTPETYPSFEELRRPGTLYGARMFSFGTLVYMLRWYFLPHLKDGDESYQDFRERLKAARLHLEHLPNDSRVVVVSHSVFITLFAAHLCNERKLGPIGAFRYLLKILFIKNASITKLIYRKTDNQNVCAWYLV
jgi:probable phosphoglycerate mutase